MNEKGNKLERDTIIDQVFDIDKKPLPRATKNQSGTTYKKTIVPQIDNNVEDIHIPRPPLSPNIPTIEEIKSIIVGQLRKKLFNKYKHVFVLNSLTEDKMEKLYEDEDLPPVLRVPKKIRNLEQLNKSFVREREVTNPDIGAVTLNGKTQVDLVNSFVEGFDKVIEESDGSNLIEENINEFKKRLMDSGLTLSDLVLIDIQRSMNCNVAWWDSSNSLVRLWGQINAPYQVFEDTVILNDLLEVLGQEFLFKKNNSLVDEQFQLWEYLNKEEIKDEIQKKYAHINLDVIIGKDK